MRLFPLVHRRIRVFALSRVVRHAVFVLCILNVWLCRAKITAKMEDESRDTRPDENSSGCSQSSQSSSKCITKGV